MEQFLGYQKPFFMKKKLIFPFTNEESLAQKESQDCHPRPQGMHGRSCSFYGTLSTASLPGQGGCPDHPPTWPFIPWVAQPWGFFPTASPPTGWGPSPWPGRGSRLLLPRRAGWDSPGPLGRSSPTLDFPSGRCWNAQPSLCVFSLWVGSWAGNPVHILSPPSLWRTKVNRAEAREETVVRGRLQAHAQNSVGTSSKPIIISSFKSPGSDRYKAIQPNSV